MTALNSGQLCLKVTLVHKDGARLHPVTIKNRKTGRIAWNVAKPGSGNNVRTAAIEVDDQDELVRYLLNSRFSVRCQAVDGRHKGLFNPDGHNIVRAERSNASMTGEPQ